MAESGGGRGRARGRGRPHSSPETGRRDGRFGGTQRARGSATRGESENWRRRDGATSARDPENRSPPVKAIDGPVIGELLTMCSQVEVRSRQEIKDISRFEKADASWAVKKYRRPAAGRVDVDVAELRPPHVLAETLAHLFANVLPSHGCGFDWRIDSAVSVYSKAYRVTKPNDFLALYHFLSDRLRSVRQDFVIQRVQGPARVQALIQIARFYVLASFRAVEVLPSGDKTRDWSETLNDQQLASALTEIHAHLQSAGDESADEKLHQEALALDVILHLQDPRAVSLLLLKVPSKLLHSDAVRRVLDLFAAFHTGDSNRFFKAYRVLPSLQQYLALRHLPGVWVASMHRLNKAYGKMDRIAFSDITKWLDLPVQSAGSLCFAMNVHTEEEVPASSTVESSVTPPSTAPQTIWFARFKVNAIREELDSVTESSLIRWKAEPMKCEIMRQTTAPALITGAREM